MKKTSAIKKTTTLHITQREFKQRRKTLMQQMGRDSIAILPAAPMRTRNRDVHYPFRQDSDFYYLSGFAEPEAVLVLKPGRAHGESLMFCREKDPAKEQWDGLIQGTEGVTENFGFDDAFPITDIDEILPGLIEGCDKVYYSMGTNPEFDSRVMNWVNVIRGKVRSGAQPPNEFMVLDHLLHDMRLYKSKKEVQLMRRAAKISAHAHSHAMRVCKPGMMEYQLEAEYIHQFMLHDSSWAYPSIVGGGANACVLHYIDNNQALEDGDLVLIDAGCEYNYYASDITRTFPVNGRFSTPQRAIYEIVLRANLAGIAAVKPGNHWNDPHVAAVKVITKGLLDLGLLKGSLNKLIKEEAYRPFYMHRTGHWLGLDVHDVGEYKVDDQWRVLEAGMVMTVEPGIYIAPDNKKVAQKWRGIGVRIEDDVLVTASGSDVLSQDVPKAVKDVEALME